ncbi:MAG: site-specific DNA-methyltransferase [Paludibacteraceae bacterium]|nr:site-specific DNA-methyltransferase [Paludibacteraceae bacterium]
MYGAIIIDGNIQSSISLLNTFKGQLDSSGNVFVLVRNEVDAIGDVIHDFFDVIDAADKLGYFYVNTIVAPTSFSFSALPDNVLYIVWLAKDKNHFFNKDNIRESHIWKDVEWGKRAKNYNPKGKDPGNVWIPTKDDGKANITEHVALSLSDIINRINSCSFQEGLDTIYITSSKPNTLDLDGRIKVKYLAEDCSTKVKRKKEFEETIVNSRKRTTGTIIWGTSEKMDKIPNHSVKVVVTSPPYWDLKDYYKAGQIGQESYKTYLERLYKVWNGCYDKLTNSGSLWLNINIRTKNGKVILIPRDFIIQCKAIGFHYKGVLIWHKSSGIPTHDKNIVDRHEYVLVFSKDKVLHINSRITEFVDYKNASINGGLFWNINRKAGSVGKQFIHPAIYPNELVSRIVKITTEENDTVLDPFLGSGTTLIASVIEGRNCIGYEYNEGFKDLIKSRFDNEVASKDSSLLFI